MMQKYSIELIEEHDAVNFYSVHLCEEELSELERFFEKFPEGCEYDEDIDKILIFGNGGVKDCATWQESKTLSDYVETLVDTSRFISSRLSNGTIYIVDKEIIGNLNFTRDEKK